MIIEYFPPGFIALNQELATGYHPQLARNLAHIAIDELDMRIAAIALYCGIILDGDYDLIDKNRICERCVERLEKMRVYPNSQIILPPN